MDGSAEYGDCYGGDEEEEEDEKEVGEGEKELGGGRGHGRGWMGMSKAGLKCGFDIRTLNFHVETVGGHAVAENARTIRRPRIPQA